MCIKIISAAGCGDDKALLCEIPSSIADQLNISIEGDVDALSMIKLLRRAYIQVAQAEQIHSSQEITEVSGQLSRDDRKELFDLIFNQQRAVDLPTRKAC